MNGYHMMSLAVARLLGYSPDLFLSVILLFIFGMEWSHTQGIGHMNFGVTIFSRMSGHSLVTTLIYETALAI
jgi:lysylphosphatidylglycerol synthetase-like protein (DUF2156 family)